MYITAGHYVFFLIVNAEVYPIGTQPMEEPDNDEALFLEALNRDHMITPNWEAVGISVLLDFRKDRHTVRAYASEDILMDYRRKIQPLVTRYAREFYPTASFEWNDMPAHAFDFLRGHQTFTRKEDGSWGRADVPVARAIFARAQRQADVGERGIPGGPCQVIDMIEEARIPAKEKDDLKTDVYKGRDLDNAGASKVYDHDTINLPGKLIRRAILTNHMQYRMDLRAVTADAVTGAFIEFERWWNYKKQNQNKISREDQEILQNLVSGDPVRFTAQRMRLVIVFQVDRNKDARLLSTWWQGKKNPPPPKPGECHVGTTRRAASVDFFGERCMRAAVKAAMVKYRGRKH